MDHRAERHNSKLKIFIVYFQVWRCKLVSNLCIRVGSVAQQRGKVPISNWKRQISASDIFLLSNKYKPAETSSGFLV
jgi:hypothetical protein